MPVLLVCLQAFDIMEAAIAWVGRATVDALLSFAYAPRTLHS